MAANEAIVTEWQVVESAERADRGALVRSLAASLIQIRRRRLAEEQTAGENHEPKQ